jgi:peptidoglycan/LPS O-acetylase OafA/YrhL
MERDLRLSRRFAVLTALAAIWTALAGASFSFIGGQFLLGGVQALIGIVLLGFLVDGRLVKERVYPRSILLLVGAAWISVLMILGCPAVAMRQVYDLGPFFAVFIIVFLVLILLAVLEVSKALRNKEVSD